VFQVHDAFALFLGAVFLVESMFELAWLSSNIYIVNAALKHSNKWLSVHLRYLVENKCR
jgi:hypothetical protein